MIPPYVAIDEQLMLKAITLVIVLSGQTDIVSMN
jgi:hypothetical protein